MTDSYGSGSATTTATRNLFHGDDWSLHRGNKKRVWRELMMMAPASPEETVMVKRKLFDEMMEGLAAMKEHREAS
jgi:hypothetical protein